MSKYYETEKFKQLNRKWSEKLKKAGFQDAEQEDGNLKIWSNTRGAMLTNKTLARAKEDYYRMAGQFLQEHKFNNKLDHDVWEYHAQGISLEKIDGLMGFVKGKANRVVKKLVPIMKRTIRLETEGDDEY